jgi:hypothetical protein
MNKRIVAGSLAIALAVGGYGVNYTHTRHPRTSCNADGCEFVYDLCVPVANQSKCEPRTFNFGEKFGSMTTESELRKAADARADLAEGKHTTP